MVQQEEYIMLTHLLPRISTTCYFLRIFRTEYQREGWTFHAKGLWYTPSMSISSLPCLTMVGSPNFGYRSVSKDLETQVTILTTNRGLQEQMGQEQSKLYEQGAEVRSYVILLQLLLGLLMRRVVFSTAG